VSDADIRVVAFCGSDKDNILWSDYGKTGVRASSDGGVTSTVVYTETKDGAYDGNLQGMWNENTSISCSADSKTAYLLMMAYMYNGKPFCIGKFENAF
jgi:hypothetical protein